MPVFYVTTYMFQHLLKETSKNCSELVYLQTLAVYVHTRPLKKTTYVLIYESLYSEYMYL